MRDNASWALYPRLYLMLICISFLLYTFSYSQNAKAQTPYYLVCNVYCKENGITLTYPSDHSKQGPSSAWFVSFTPTASSPSGLSIFVDADMPSGMSLYSSFLNHVNALESSTSFRNVVLSQGPDRLGSMPAYYVLYTYTSPSSGNIMLGIDFLTLHNGMVYNLSFIDNRGDFLSIDMPVIDHVKNSFRFLTP